VDSKFSLVLYTKTYDELFKIGIDLVPLHEPPPPSIHLTNADTIDMRWVCTTPGAREQWDHQLYVTQDFGSHVTVYGTMVSLPYAGSRVDVGNEVRMLVPKGMLLVDVAKPLTSRPLLSVRR
jgi:hypothetical protein